MKTEYRHDAFNVYRQPLVAGLTGEGNRLPTFGGTLEAKSLPEPARLDRSPSPNQSPPE